MRHYEIVALVHPDRAERAKGIGGQIGEMVGEAGGYVHRMEDIGRRQLAYPVLGLQKAHYLLLNVECPAEVHTRLGEYLKFNEDVLRSLIVRADKALTQPSALLQQTRKEREQLSRGGQKAADADADADAESTEEESAEEASGEEEGDEGAEPQDSSVHLAEQEAAPAEEQAAPDESAQ